LVQSGGLARRIGWFETEFEMGRLSRPGCDGRETPGRAGSFMEDRMDAPMVSYNSTSESSSEELSSRCLIVKKGGIVLR
jgi:hypothetical protein